MRVTERKRVSEVNLAVAHLVEHIRLSRWNECIKLSRRLERDFEELQRRRERRIGETTANAKPLQETCKACGAELPDMIAIGADFIPDLCPICRRESL